MYILNINQKKTMSRPACGDPSVINPYSIKFMGAGTDVAVIDPHLSDEKFNINIDPEIKLYIKFALEIVGSLIYHTNEVHEDVYMCLIYHIYSFKFIGLEETKRRYDDFSLRLSQLNRARELADETKKYLKNIINIVWRLKRI